ncbi:MAG: nickel-dependent lactate racemase [Desulfohalobiaceae bacterium]|nr:nickel-dependent lactate racemase [Desulfohalobiaceae bacterium]
MRTSLLYGEKELEIEVPDRTAVLDAAPVPALSDQVEGVRRSLEEPVGAPSLQEMAQGRGDACVVISDITRPVPNKAILSPLLASLERAGIPRERITILVATGMHRPNLGRELISMVGEEIATNYHIVNHECEKDEDLRRITTIEGAPIEINRHYLDADLKILTGLIEPHFYAGYSGGRKAILPGIASYETMKFMHSYQLIDHPRVANCILEGNIFHEYGLQVMDLAGADFLLNVVINRDNAVSGVFAGDPRQAHLSGCRFVEEHAVVDLTGGERDLVITSGGGYPLDSNFYQISKALTCAKDILKPGGTVVVACECREGLGSEDFCGIMRSCGTPQDFFGHYCHPENFVKDQWCAQNIYQALDKAGEVHVYSGGLSREDVEGMGGIYVDDPQKHVERLAGQAERIAVSPAGPYVVGRLTE